MSRLSVLRRQSFAKPQPGFRLQRSHTLASALLSWHVMNDPQQYNKLLDAGDGQYTGTASATGATNVTWAQGLWGQCVNFGTGAAYIDTANYADGLPSFAVSCWCKTTYLANNIWAIAKLDSYSTGAGWALGFDAGKVSALVQDSGAAHYSQKDTTTLFNDGKWHHIVAVYVNYAVSAIYVDGVSRSLTDLSSGTVSTNSNTHNIRFGNDQASDGAYQGSLDNIAIFNRAITAAEALDLYVNPFAMAAPRRLTLPSLPGAQTVSLLGMPGSEIFGTPALALNLLPPGMISREALGTPACSLSLQPGGMISREQEGAITIYMQSAVPSQRILTPANENRIL